MLLQVTHETHYRYRPVVETAQHMAYLQPLNHAGQRLLRYALTITPRVALQRDTLDVYGNMRCFFALQTPHDALSVVAHSLVSTQATEPPESDLSWEQVRERFRYHAGARFDPATEFLFASPFVPRNTEFAAYARPSFVPGSSVLGVAQSLMERIHADFTYESQSTQINTPALEALAMRKGVCQDFAHIMLACLRAQGLPARYVSGYLLTQSSDGAPKLIGSDASHAWVSVYVPDLPEGARWCDFDPTNNRWGWHAPGMDYVTLATGRDFGDVSPLRGVIQGGASHTLTVGVTVQDVGENGDLFASPSPSQLQSQGQNQGQSQTQSQRVIN